MDEIGRVAGLEALGVSESPTALAMLRQSGRSSPRSTNCPDSIFLTRLPGMGGTPSPIVTGCSCVIGSSNVLLMVERGKVLGSGRSPTAGEAIRSYKLVGAVAYETVSV